MVFSVVTCWQKAALFNQKQFSEKSDSWRMSSSSTPSSYQSQALNESRKKEEKKKKQKVKPSVLKEEWKCHISESTLHSVLFLPQPPWCLSHFQNPTLQSTVLK
jgi:hypothetical protein